MTFFNKTKKKFYGRTYITTPIRLLTDQHGSAYQTQDPINVYFHSRIEKGNENVLVVEVQIVGKIIDLSQSFSAMDDQNLVKGEQNLGWCELFVYDSQATQAKPAYLYEGTPRVLLDSTIKGK